MKTLDEAQSIDEAIALVKEMAARSDIVGLVSAIGSGKWWYPWDCASSALVRIGRPAVPELLRSHNERGRDRIVNTLGLIGDERAVNFLLNSTMDDDANVRAEAAKALGRMRISDSASYLIALLRDPYHQVCGAAIGAIRELGIDTVEVRDALVQTAGDWASKNLSGIRSTNRIAISAAVLAGHLGDLRVLELLIYPLTHNAGGIGQFPWDDIAKALAGIGKAAVPALVQVLERVSHYEVCNCALQALGLIGDKSAAECVARKLRHSVIEPAIFVEAAIALGMIGDERARAPLLELLANPECQAWRTAATRALEMIKSKGR